MSLDYNSVEILIIIILLIALIFAIKYAYEITSLNSKILASININKTKENFQNVLKNTSQEGEISQIFSEKNILNEYDKLKGQVEKLFHEKNKDVNYSKYVGNIKDKHNTVIAIPTMSFDNKILINDIDDIENLIDQSKNFKNVYSAGEHVTNHADFNVLVDDICYENNLELKNNNPNCMVCTVSDDINDKTNTNISSVCIHNGENGEITHNKCKMLCKIKN